MKAKVYLAMDVPGRQPRRHHHHHRSFLLIAALYVLHLNSGAKYGAMNPTGDQIDRCSPRTRRKSFSAGSQAPSTPLESLRQHRRHHQRQRQGQGVR